MSQTAIHYLDRAKDKLAMLNLGPPQSATLPAMGTLKQIESVDPDRVMAVARTLQQESHFSAIVRDNISGMKVAERYQDIAENFNSVRDDTKMIFKQMEKGKVSMSGKLKRYWMKTRRGSIAKRFDDIRASYIDVTNDSLQTIERERSILDAYADFRSSLKQAEIDAISIHEQAASAYSEMKEKFAAANAAVEQADDPKDRAQMELARDTMRRDFEEAERREQIAKDMADNLRISYSTSEAVMGRLQQTTRVKERVYEQSVTFFSTNETVFTALSAAVTSLHGLHESTETLNAMKRGANESLETLAETGSKVMERGVEAGYGPTISADSVKKLVDSIVEFQQNTRTKAREMRELATKNAKEISDYAEEGKRRYAAMLADPSN